MLHSMTYYSNQQILIYRWPPDMVKFTWMGGPGAKIPPGRCGLSVHEPHPKCTSHTVSTAGYKVHLNHSHVCKNSNPMLDLPSNLLSGSEW